MKFAHQILNDKCIIQIHGNLVLDDTKSVRKYVNPFLTNKKILGIVLNFKNVNFIDSSGIGLIVSIFKVLQKRNLKLVLSHLNTKNLEIFQITRLDKVLIIAKTDEDALEMMKENN